MDIFRDIVWQLPVGIKERIVARKKAKIKAIVGAVFKVMEDPRTASAIASLYYNLKDQFELHKDKWDDD